MGDKVSGLGYGIEAPPDVGDKVSGVMRSPLEDDPPKGKRK